MVSRLTFTCLASASWVSPSLALSSLIRVFTIDSLVVIIDPHSYKDQTHANNPDSQNIFMTDIAVDGEH